LFDKDLYQKDYPPLGLNGENTEVIVGLTILNIGTIDELQKTVNLKFFLNLKWYIKYFLFYITLKLFLLIDSVLKIFIIDNYLKFSYFTNVEFYNKLEVLVCTFDLDF